METTYSVISTSRKEKRIKFKAGIDYAQDYCKWAMYRDINKTNDGSGAMGFSCKPRERK